MQIFAASYLLPISSPPITGGALAVDNERIVAVGTLAEVRASCAGPVVDFPGSVLLPGLVNAHTHLELTHFPSWKLRKALDYLPQTYLDWVSQVVKIKRTLTQDELVLSVREGMRLSVASGTTAVGDIVSDYTLVPLYQEALLKGRFFLEALGHDPVQCEALLERMKRQLEQPFGSLLPGLSPHTPHTVSKDLFRGVQALSRNYRVKKAIHLSESADEASFMHDTTGPIAEELYPMAHWESFLPSPMKTTSTQFLDSLGVLDASTLAIHAVHITPADAAILKRCGVTVVLCPRSNQRLAVGVAPHKLLKSLGIPLALGTDSLASNDSLSLWDELRFLHELAPEHFTPFELLLMATLGGARALGIDADAGSLEVGKRADFQVVSTHDVKAGTTVCAAIMEQGRLEDVYIGGVPVK